MDSFTKQLQQNKAQGYIKQTISKELLKDIELLRLLYHKYMWIAQNHQPEEEASIYLGNILSQMKMCDESFLAYAKMLRNQKNQEK